MEITKFKGLKNTVAEERLLPGELSEAYDIDIDGVGAVRTRQGLTAVSATASHSMWSSGDFCFVAQGTTLYRMSSSGALTQVATLTSTRPISYMESNGTVYWSNGTDTGRIVRGAAKRWGIAPPVGQPRASVTVGSLPAATYKYAMTFIRSDGEESGARTAATFELNAVGGIAFTSFPTSSDPDVAGFSLYLSGPNGTEMYHIGTFPSSTTTVNHRNEATRLGVALDPEYAEAAPAGTIVEKLAGVAYVADGSVIWYSDPYRMERFRRGSRFLQFPGLVTMVAAVDDGLFVATESSTWFLGGTEPTTMKPSRVLESGAIPGTVAKVDSSELDADDDEDTSPTRPSVFWMSTHGIIAGRSGGQVEKLTYDTYGIPVGHRGSALLRTDRGNVTYVSSVEGSSTGNQH